ncbi:PREDICTED: uncharacterized protein LOC109181042 isoform X2 [Ipomoea nil]|uniref:uncharacterized protein LOC109181042 isoform X2 n=1 Tax=Ipomoea nil TaxID=35883 RepID=UPI000900929B|nr:PREDICTED: uncharacterized protein LOC109181042 isoform X2 [Ipomoea nil]
MSKRGYRPLSSVCKGFISIFFVSGHQRWYLSHSLTLTTKNVSYEFIKFEKQVVDRFWSKKSIKKQERILSITLGTYIHVNILKEEVKKYRNIFEEEKVYYVKSWWSLLQQFCHSLLALGILEVVMLLSVPSLICLCIKSARTSPSFSRSSLAFSSPELRRLQRFIVSPAETKKSSIATKIRKSTAKDDFKQRY